MKMLRFYSCLMWFGMCFLLAGCGESTSPTSSSGASALDGASAGSQEGSLSGQVVKGVTAYAVVSVYAPDGAGGYTLLASTVSDVRGAYTLDLPFGYAGPIKIVASSAVPPATPTRMRCDAAAGCGSYPDTSSFDLNENLLVDFGEWFETGADFSLRAVAMVDAGTRHAVNLTPLSSMAAAWAEQFPQGLDARSILAANARVARAFGFEPADMEAPLGDIADPLWLAIASPQQVKLSLLMAAFAELAAQNVVSQQFAIEFMSDLFASGQGRLPETSGDGVPGIADFVAAMQSISGALRLPDATQSAVSIYIANEFSRLQTGALSAGQTVTIADVLTPLGQLGVDLAEVLAVTGLNDPAAFIRAQTPYNDWLWREENKQLLPLAVDTVLQAVVGSLYLELLPASTGTVTIADDGVSTVKINLKTKKLLVTGVRFGQTVNLTVSLTKFSEGLNSGLFNYGVVGTTANAIALGSINGTLAINTAGTNLVPLRNALQSLLAGNDSALVELQAAMVQLLGSAKAQVTLVGTARLVRNSDTSQVLGGAVNLAGFVNMGAAVGETIATLDVFSGDLVLPNGDHFYGLEGTPVLTVRVRDNATLVLDGAGRVLGLPVATAHAEGTMSNARALFVHIRNTLIAQLSDTSADLNTLITALLDFDIAQLSVHGEGVINMPGMPSGRDHQYRASLANLTATVYQPHSDAVAMTATLNIEDQAIQFLLGDERWDLRLLSEPETHLMLLGPDGQSVEASQADIFNFLSATPMGFLVHAGLLAP